jgi:hypothetical protein
VANQIQVKISTVASTVPSSLAVGEIALNLVDKRLFSANSTAIFDALQLVTVDFTVSNNAGGGFRVGNSTVNAFTNSTSLKFANSTVNTGISLPNSVQYAATNYFLHANGEWVQFSGGGAGNPGGSNTFVQTNDSGSFYGNDQFTYNKTTSTVSVANLVVTNSVTMNASRMTIGDTSVNTAINALAIVVSNSTVTASLNTTAYFLGNSTINAVINTSSIAFANSTLAQSFTLATIQNTKYATITYVIDGGGSAITTGFKGVLEVPFGCTINRVTTLADQSGSIVVDIWKDTYANYPPVVADTITASAKPTLSSAIKAQDSTLTGWTTSIAAGDILGFNVDSITTCTRVTISLRVSKT